VKFDHEHKVNIETLKLNDARAYLKFLWEEICRKRDAKREAEAKIEFEKSAIVRHNTDIYEAFVKREQVKEKFKL